MIAGHVDVEHLDAAADEDVVDAVHRISAEECPLGAMAVERQLRVLQTAAQPSIRGRRRNGVEVAAENHRPAARFVPQPLWA
jgi:hypothetical protein